MIWSWQPVFYWNCKDAKAWDSLDWYQGNSNKDGTHPTQKPIEFFEKIIKSVECETVYEPFGGSGTTIIAAENLSRRCYAMEISEKYGAVILERFHTAFPTLEIKRL
jgi:DNA modification methylase